MKGVLHTAVLGFFVAVIAAIIFVQAGKSGQSGGQQSSAVIKAGGSALSNVAAGLESGQ